MRGDAVFWSSTLTPIQFQSAPRILMRGDHQRCKRSRADLSFQSAPRILMRGDPIKNGPVPICAVSIRAPHSHAGRLPSRSEVAHTTRFQSAPRILMRGDIICCPITGPLLCFNPRPAFSCGATWAWPFDTPGGRVSIRAPHSHAGRPFPDVHGLHYHLVSIRAPHSHAGRPAHGPAHGPAILFQSAPRILMRGDTTTATANAIAKTVSIRAPHSHAGRQYSNAKHIAELVFQSAPRILMRGDLS